MFAYINCLINALRCRVFRFICPVVIAHSLVSCEYQRSTTTSTQVGTESQPIYLEQIPAPRPVRKTVLYSDPKGQLTFSTRTVDTLNGSTTTFLITGASQRIHALPMAPIRREPILDKGTWVVVVFSLVSVPDVESAVNAVHVIDSRDDNINLGVRPFLRYDETNAWYKPYGDRASPLWLIIQDGKVVHETKGMKLRSEVSQMIADVLGR